MRKLYEIFKILQNLKKNSFREYYSRKYSIFRDVFSELAGWALAMDLGGILGVQLTLFQLGGGAGYAHHIIACQPRFENLMTSLIFGMKMW